MDQHIVYLGWSLGEEKNEVAIVDIQRDNWLPRIELQGDQFILWTNLIRGQNFEITRLIKYVNCMFKDLIHPGIINYF